MDHLKPTPIGVMGATGFTGRRCVEALERFGAPYVVIGRRPGALSEVAGPGCVDQRVADTSDPKSLRAAFEGLGAVISTVGPFTLHGKAVVQAAIDAGVHLTDTSAEVVYLDDLGALDKAAELAGVTILAGNGCDFGFAYLAAALADEAVQGATELHFHQWMTDFRPTGGTLDSILRQSKARPLVLADGKIGRSRGLGLHRKLVRDLDGWAVPWTGAEPVTLPRDFPLLRDVSCFLVLSLPESLGFALATRLMGRAPQRLLNLGARLAGRLPEPSDAECRGAMFTLLAEAVHGEDIARVRIDAPDVYGITGDIAAVSAILLASGEGRAAGVRTTGVALDALSVLRALEPRGVRVELPDEPLRRSA